MIASALKQFELLAEFNDEDRECIFELLEERSVRQGRRLFGEGSEAEGMVLVVTGRVRVEGKRCEKPEVVEAPFVIGALSLVNVGPRESTLVAETQCEVLMLPRTSYRRLVDDYPRTACRLAEAIVDDVAGLVRPVLDWLVG
ncbi:MAG: cyclic nucleotide-binding domain-containing protein [Deltaproteobacteria bacterium]|nr:cyclic nucleotide-binding domain-containing protein [Deltaproteobacteria bacterium]MBW2384763.1 cyclic nucleotide-binding domain-containing protein [Deltaproteobacteria bacterium]MBW2696539.1 cyclic nucleotide-binding domain-containing protein [Deltaproteobacteria bacterium]